ncbi:MAG TPA: hypothetical protein VFC33_08835 [Acidimicrobiia bacterium]|nr:hypothetical protein [Acidimicrobiia bacterium]
MVRRRILLPIVALALGALATQIAVRVAAEDHRAAAHTGHTSPDHHVAVPVPAVRALRSAGVSTPWEPAVAVASVAVAAAFTLAHRRLHVVPSRRVLWDAGDDWRSLLLGAPPAA